MSAAGTGIRTRRQVAPRKDATGMRGSVAADFGSADRVEWHLDNWRDWKRTGLKQGAWGAVAVGLSSGGTSRDFDDMAEDSDRRCAVIVDTLIHDLPATQTAAVHHAYLAAVFRFPRSSFLEQLMLAKRAVGDGLKKRGVY